MNRSPRYPANTDFRGQRIPSAQKPVAPPPARGRPAPPQRQYPPTMRTQGHPRPIHHPNARPPLQNVSPQKRPPRPLSPQIEARRRAAIAAKRKAAARARRIRTVCAVCMGVIVLILAVLCIRACASRASVPASNPQNTGTSDATTTPITTATTTAPTPVNPVVPRPMMHAATVSLTDQISSSYGVLISLSDQIILAEKLANAKMNPASMTKVMSLIVAYEHIENLSDTVTVTSTIIDPLYREEASLAGFAPGEAVSLLDLLYGMILPSGAEASVALAEYVAGSEENFVSLMNEKAAEIGLKNTHFTNCTGLHGTEHYSTAVEMAMILAYAMEYETCAKILSTYQHTTAPTEKHPEGILLESTMFSRMYGDEPDGVTIFAGKTGYTNEAHHCLMSYAKDDATGEAYIFVSADCTEKFGPIFDAIKVYSDYTNKIDPTTGQQVYLP